MESVAGLAEPCVKDVNIGVTCSNASGTTTTGIAPVRQPAQRASKFCTGRGRAITRRVRPRRTRFNPARSASPTTELHMAGTLPGRLFCVGPLEVAGSLCAGWCTIPLSARETVRGYAVDMMHTFGGSTPEVVLAQAKLCDPQVDRADCRVAVPAADRPGPLLDVVFASVAVERYGGCDRGEGACVCSIRYGGRRG